MSKEALVAFLRRVAEDRQLRGEVAEVAGRHGFRFSADELGAVDFGKAAERIAAAPDWEDDEPFDPGLGMAEFPG